MSDHPHTKAPAPPIPGIQPSLMVSVVIPTLNREQPLCTTLRYFLEIETYPSFEIIIIDQSDSHNTETEAFLKTAGKRLQHVRVPYKGLTRARNNGVRLSRGEIVLFVDDDVEPSPGFIAAHVEPYSDPAIMGVTGPVLIPGACLKSKVDLDPKEYHALTSRAKMRFDVDFAFNAQWAAGGNMSFRRTLIEELGGFDEKFYGSALGEDVEFCWRAEKAGGLIRYSPSARLVHYAAKTGGCRNADVESKYVQEVAENSYYFALKIGLPALDRYRMMWHHFRLHVANRPVLFRKRLFPSLACAFLRGLYRARRRLLRLN